MTVITVVECPSLESSDLELSTTNRTAGTTVGLSCDDFGHRPSGDVEALTCLATGNWSNPVPDCEWSWDFSTQDKVIFGTSVAAVSFVIVIIIVVFVAYFCCYKKRKDNVQLVESSSGASSHRMEVTGSSGGQQTHPDHYFAYQNQRDRYDEFYANGSFDKPWLGYIPRPKVSGQQIYN